MVANPGELAPEVRLQLFKRSFTTKRQGHGLGTWSVKLFTEGYLAGRIGYESAAGTTTFWIELPTA
jgi:signal transduction histidine kinase